MDFGVEKFLFLLPNPGGDDTFSHRNGVEEPSDFSYLSPIHISNNSWTLVGMKNCAFEFCHNNSCQIYYNKTFIVYGYSYFEMHIDVSDLSLDNTSFPDYLPLVDFNWKLLRFSAFSFRKLSLADYILTISRVCNFVCILVITLLCMYNLPTLAFLILRACSFAYSSGSLKYDPDPGICPIEMILNKIRVNFGAQDVRYESYRLQEGGRVCKIFLKYLATERILHISYSGDLRQALYAFWKETVRQDYEIQGLPAIFGFNETSPIRFVKCTLMFVYDWKRSSGTVHRVIALLRWFDAICDIQELRKSASFIQIASKYMLEHGLSVQDGNLYFGNGSDEMADILAFDSHEDIEVHGISEYATVFVNFCRQVCNSSAVQSSLALVVLMWHILFVFPVGKFDIAHIKLVEAQMRDNCVMDISRLGNVVLEHISLLASCASEFYKTRDPNVFLNNANQVARFADDVTELSLLVKELPEVAELSPEHRELESRVREKIEQGQVLLSSVRVSQRSAYLGSLSVLRQLAVELATRARAHTSRVAPFSLLVYGGPKIGKSFITDLILSQFRTTNAYAKSKGLDTPLPKDGVYHRTLGETYWSGYMNSYWGIVYDDLGQTSPQIQGFALEINELIHVINSAMYFPEMAGVDEKGKRYVAPQIVVATSNNLDINSNHAVRTPSAVLRRFPFVVKPKVLPQFADEGGMIDETKTRGDTSCWTFTIDKVIVSGNGVRYETLHADLTTSEFVKWVNDASIAHFQNQSGASAFRENVERGGACLTCGILRTFCQCPPAALGSPVVVQGLEDYPWHYSVFAVILLLLTILLGLTCELSVYTVCAFSLLLVCMLVMLFQVSVLFGKAQYIGDFVAECVNHAAMMGLTNVEGVVDFIQARILHRLGITYILDLKAKCYQKMLTARRFVERNAFVVCIMNVIVMGAVILWAMRLFRVDVQGVAEGVEPPPASANIDNPWKSSAKLSVSAYLSSPSKSCSPEKFLDLFRSSLGVMQFEGVSGPIRCLNVKGNYWLVPKHYLVSVGENISNTMTIHRAHFYEGSRTGTISCKLSGGIS